MKCPKCDYLGFETGDRCKNCGYDFSLLPAGDDPMPDLPLRAPPDGHATAVQMEAIDPAPVSVGAAGVAEPRAPLPLFSRMTGDEDEPLVRLSANPRPPLAVRRTPDASRVRAASTAPTRAPEPMLTFSEDRQSTGANSAARIPADVAHATAAHTQAAATVTMSIALGGAGRRVGAASIDHAILLGVDVTVLYLTLRLAALPMSAWASLPPVPMLMFLTLLALAYFTGFTALGGQTIGKMAMGIRVVSDARDLVDAPRALARTLAAGLSVLTLGLGYLPGLVRADGRALHDRIAHTRVVTARSA